MGTGLKIMAGQQTMSGLIVDLTGQTLVLLFIFGCEHYTLNVRSQGKQLVLFSRES